MNGLLFESYGSNENRTKLLKVCGCILIVCGVGLVLLGNIALSYTKSKIVIILAGICTALIGLFYMRKPSNDYTKNAYLRIYSDHIEGRQLAPTKEFSLKYSEIFDVNSMEIFSNEFLIIKSGAIQYSILVNDVNTAYQIISGKLDELEKI